MAPSVVEPSTPPAIETKGKAVDSHWDVKPPSEYIKEPLKLKGVLDQYKSFDVTPVIGREFPDAKLVDWLDAPDADELLRDLAITISQRGVVFFRAQDGLTNDKQKDLIQRLGRLGGKPESSGLHIHPILNSDRELGGSDPEISTISSVQFKNIYKQRIGALSSKRQSAKKNWHSDITFEQGSTFGASRLLIPTADSITPNWRRYHTLWASGYELYDRISTPYQKFLDTLTATYAQPGFNKAAEEGGFELYDKPRGSPENVGTELSAIHPVIRTNPVTGWKSVFAVGVHCQHINDVTEEESRHLLEWFTRLVQENHDLQVRLKWQNPNDLAIWDNRSTYHSATYDYDEERFGNRAVGIGERPYFDKASLSRSEVLAAAKHA